MIIIYVLYTAATILMLAGIGYALWLTTRQASGHQKVALQEDPTDGAATTPGEPAKADSDVSQDLLALLSLELEQIRRAQREMQRSTRILNAQYLKLRSAVSEISNSEGLTHGILEHIDGNSYYITIASNPEKLSLESLNTGENRSPMVMI